MVDLVRTLTSPVRKGSDRRIMTTYGTLVDVRACRMSKAKVFARLVIGRNLRGVLVVGGGGSVEWC